MISPHTPPGTKVALLVSAGKFASGDVVTVGRMVALSGGPVSASLEEHGGRNCYSLRVLRYLDLPECLTSLLTTQPIDELVE
jgi:hypothetical protein